MRRGLALQALLTGVLLGTALILSTGAPVGEEARYVGEVEVDETDENGDIVSIYLADTDEGDLLIARTGPWDELVQAVGETVEAWGVLGESDNEDFDGVITVTKFRILEEDDEDEDDEDDD